MRIVVIGAVESTARIIEGLLRNHASLVGVMGLDTSVSKNVSGYAGQKLIKLSKKNSIPFESFAQINNKKSISKLRSWEPDVIFAVGFSQIVGSEVLAIPKIGAIGFHPTMLPKGRGRAPLAWITYEAQGGAATFFQIQAGIDDGPIFAQEPFVISSKDHAEDVEKHLLFAIDRCLDRWLPRLLKGEWYPRVQDDSIASYNGIRRPLDGLIDWNDPVNMILGKIRAASRPHPGAFTYINDRKVIIWKASLEPQLNYKGIPGRVLMTCPDRGILVQAGDGLLWLLELQDAESPNVQVEVNVGQLMGYYSQSEIFMLKHKVSELKQIVKKMLQKQ
jgi:methionyl-tRNA formyltransferase